MLRTAPRDEKGRFVLPLVVEGKGPKTGVEVVRERYITLKADLTHEVFDSFFNHKSDWHPELEKIQPSTRKKLRQVLFRMLSEADLLTADNMIAPAMLSPDLIALISCGNRQELSFFPAFESDMKGTP